MSEKALNLRKLLPWSFGTAIFPNVLRDRQQRVALHNEQLRQKLAKGAKSEQIISPAPSNKKSRARL